MMVEDELRTRTDFLQAMQLRGDHCSHMILNFKTVGNVGPLPTILGITYVERGIFRLQCANNHNFALEISILDNTAKGCVYHEKTWIDEDFEVVQNEWYVAVYNRKIPLFRAAFKYPLPSA